MSGPWYECNGPSAKEVRRDVYGYITTSNVGRVKYQKEKDKRGKMKDKFKEHFIGRITSPQQKIWTVDIVGEKKQYIASLDKENNNVSIFDNEGRLQNGFPLAGGTTFDIVDLFQENSNTLVVGNNNQIYAYKVKF